MEQLKSIDTLIGDIHALFLDGHDASEENVLDLSKRLAATIARRLAEAKTEREPRLSMSMIGKPDRQIWMEFHSKGEPEKLTAENRIKFLFGDILELLLLFLAKEAGHTVANEQDRVEISGISGRMDATIDGVLVDVKSASSYSFQKFASGRLNREDPFGYMWQLAAYREGMGATDSSAFFVIDKQLGKMCLDVHAKEEWELYDVRKRIDHLKELIKLEKMPDHCYGPEPDGKSGNEKLSVGCSYCKHKDECWPGLRTFIYSTGPRFLTTVARVPDVPEVTNNNKQEGETANVSE